MIPPSNETMEKPSSERRSKRSHKAILAAAEFLLAERGYADVTIDQIAARAGVGKATIYRWWPNKAAVFMEVYTVLAEQTQQPVDTGSLEGDLQLQIRNAFKLFRTTVAGVALAGFVAEGQSNPEIAVLLRQEFASRRRQLNATILRRAVKRGEIGTDVAIDVVSDMITGAVYYPVLIGQPSFTDSFADEIVRVILHGVTGRPPAPRTSGPIAARQTPPVELRLQPAKKLRVRQDKDKKA